MTISPSSFVRVHLAWFAEWFADQAFLLAYHDLEELLIGLICSIIAGRAFWLLVGSRSGIKAQQRSRVLLVGAAFLVLGLSSLIHAGIHFLRLDLNLLYQTLLGYCLGLLILIAAISAENPRSKKLLPALYLPLLLLLVPEVHRQFPLFGEFRPLVWISVAYLAGVVCMLYVAVFYRTRSGKSLWSAIGFALLCLSSIFLFFPAAIGSAMWLHGHLFRPLGFVVLLFSLAPGELIKLQGSILYRAMAVFSLLAAIPLLIFGSVMFYETISPIGLEGRRLLVFLLMLVTFATALIFGLGIIIRLVRPILRLKEAVDTLGNRGLPKSIRLEANDEIGELAQAFNGMLIKLDNAVDEQERLCRLAATGELAATLAHEIKNPLNAIGGAANYIGKNYRGQLIEEFIRVISEEVKRINSLTTALLGFAKPLPADLRSHDLNGLVRETLALLDKEAREQEIRLSVSLAGDLALVTCDYNQIKQVLINLLVNAFDAIPGQGEVAVASARVGDRICLSVRDSGKGIQPEHLKSIFHPFFTTKTRGTGLGLAISKKIAREHGGDLVVESTRGKGSTFVLWLQGE